MPKVTEQKWPVPRCPSTLRNGLSALCPVHGCYISMLTAALLFPAGLTEPHPGVTSISGLAVQGLGSECQNLKIKRQIVLTGCNYRPKRLVWRKNEKEKKIPKLSISHRQTDTRKEGFWAHHTGLLSLTSYLTEEAEPLVSVS